MCPNYCTMGLKHVINSTEVPMAIACCEHVKGQTLPAILRTECVVWKSQLCILQGEIEVEYLGVHGSIINFSGLSFVGNTPQLKYGVRSSMHFEQVHSLSLYAALISILSLPVEADSTWCTGGKKEESPAGIPVWATDVSKTPTCRLVCG